MPKKRIIAGLIALGLLIVPASAYDLKTNMLLLNAELSEVQQGFITSNQDGVENAIRRFAKDANELLGNKENFAGMLPEGKKHKASEALVAAQTIAVNTKIIIDAIENKYKHSQKQRREDAQVAFTYIQHACFKCHNVVRDSLK
jgi:hypothetical protein